MTLDVNFELKGASLVFVSPNAKVLITPSSGTSLATGHNAVLDTLPGSSKVFLATGTSIIDATQAGTYDGIFSLSFSTFIFTKIVGNSPLTFSSSGQIISTASPSFNIITGPSTLSSGGTLPVVLTNFEAVLNNGVVNLLWTTSQENNSDHFGIERAKDGTHWQTLGTVAAAGFSSIPVNYSFTDQSPSDNVNYYRLQMVDKDGKYKYSPIKVVNGTEVKGLRVFPNPANSFVNVTLGSDIGAGTTIRLINQFGQALYERKLDHAAGTTFTIPVSGYAQGNYIIQIAGEDGSRQSRKLLISR